MALSDRDYMREEHPPNCTCADCVNRRLRQTRGRPIVERYKVKKRFSLRKLLLNILVLVCIAVPIWTAYQMFGSHSLSLTYGGIILAVDIGVLIWNITVLRHYRYSAPNFWLTTLVIVGCLVILSFAGVQPFEGYKDSAVDWASIRVNGISCSTASSVAGVGEHGMWVDKTWKGNEYLYVEVSPTSRALADTSYTVDLYENGELRAHDTVSWTQPELNVQAAQEATFPISQEEYDAYYEAQSPKTAEEFAQALLGEYKSGWWKGIFSIEVHE